MEIRWSYDRLISTMLFPLPVRCHLYIESGPNYSSLRVCGLTHFCQAPTQLLPTYLLCPDSKVHMAHMGPTWVLSAPGRPHVGPMNLVVRVSLEIIVGFGTRNWAGDHFTLCYTVLDQIWQFKQFYHFFMLTIFYNIGTILQHHSAVKNNTEKCDTWI